MYICNFQVYANSIVINKIYFEGVVNSLLLHTFVFVLPINELPSSKEF